MLEQSMMRIFRRNSSPNRTGAATNVSGQGCLNRSSTTRLWKHLLAAIAATLLVAPTAGAQTIEIDEFGTARVQPDPLNAVRPADSNAAYEAVWLDDFQPPPGVGVDPVTIPQDDSVGYAVTSTVEDVLYRIGRVNGDYMGLMNDGYTSAGAFIPITTMDGGDSILAIDPRVFVSDSGRGGLNFGVTARRHVPGMDRVFSLSGWLDIDEAGRGSYFQAGIHAATIGRFWSLRGGVNMPLGNAGKTFNKVFSSEFFEDQLVVRRDAMIELGYSKSEVEFAIPLPGLARYGFEGGVGAYFVSAKHTRVDDKALGVSGRIEAQVTEDIWVNGLATTDDVFGKNVSVNFEITLPGTNPSRVLRRLTPRSYLTASDKRTYRVLRDIQSETTRRTAINPRDGEAYTFAHLDPNPMIPVPGASGVPGFVDSPLSSLAEYMALPVATRGEIDVILVRGNMDGSDTGLDTTITLLDYQQLLGTGVPHFITEATVGPVPLPELTYPTPNLTNAAAPGMDVVTLADGNVVSGLSIDAGGTARGINGLDAGDFGVRDFDINRNTIMNATVGVEIDVEDTPDATPQIGNFSENIVSMTSDDGFRLTYDDTGASSGTLFLTVNDNYFEGTLEQAIDIDLSGAAVADVETNRNEFFLLQEDEFITGTNFLGTTIDESGFIPPDTMGAVGDDHIVEMLNGAFAIYDKDTGALISRISLDEFWTDVAAQLIPAGDGTFDPRIIYDPTTERWFAAAIDGGIPGFVANSIYIAVSETSDPTGDWNGFKFATDLEDGVRFGDFDTLGINADGVYLATNNFSAPTSSGFDVSIYTIPKADLLAAVPTIAGLQRFENLNASSLGYGSSIQPAVDFESLAGTDAYLLSNAGPGTELIRADVVGGAGAGNSVTLPDTITVPAFATAPDGTQPFSPDLENVSPRFNSNVVVKNGSLWAVHAVAGSSGNSAVRWYEIDPTTNTLLQTGLIEDPALDFLDASVAVNSAGQVVVGFTGTGAGQFPSSMAAIASTDAGVTTFADPIVLAEGLGNYNVTFGTGRNRWGDYSATQLDPEFDNRFWTFQELVVRDDTWGVQVTEIITGKGGKDGISISLSDTASAALEINDNEMTGVFGFGVEIDMTDASFATLDMFRNTIIASERLPTQSAVFTIEDNVFNTSPAPYTLTNTSFGDDFRITGLSLDIGPDYFDTAGSNSRAFTSLAGTNLTTGLIPPIIPDESTSMSVAWGDFDPGETMLWSLDADFAPAPAGDGGEGGAGNFEGNNFIGSNVAIAFSTGDVFAGTMQAVSGNPDASQFIVGGPVATGPQHGLAITTSDAAFIDASTTISDNTITGFAADGMFFGATGTSTIRVAGDRNSVTANGRNGLFMQGFDDATIDVAFRNTQFDENGGRGVQGEVFDTADLTFSFTSPADPLASGPSSASNNNLQGINLKGFDAATIDATINALVDPNSDAGISVTLANDATGTVDIFDSVIIDTLDGPDVDLNGEGVIFRTSDDASLVATITDSFIDGNAGDGVAAIAEDDSDIDLTIDPTFITGNGGNGVFLRRTGTASILADLDDVFADGNAGFGLLVAAEGASVGTIPDVIVTSDDSSYSGNGLGGVNYLLFGSSTVLTTHTNDLIDGNSGDGVSVTTNVLSFFGDTSTPGAPPFAPSVFDSVVVTNNTGNGYTFNANDATRLLADIVSDATPNASFIGFNTLDGIEVNHASTDTILTPAFTEIRVGNAANTFPDVTIFQNLIDAVDLNFSGAAPVDVSIANTLINGARRVGSPSDPGVTIDYTGNDDAEVYIGQDMGADRELDMDLVAGDDLRSGVTITDIGEDGDAINVFYDRDDDGTGGSLDLLVADSQIGTGSGTIGGDGADIEVRDDGFAGYFFQNSFVGADGDAIRLLSLAEDFDESTVIVPADGAGAPFPPNTPQDLDLIGPDNIGDWVSTDSPFLNARADYNGTLRPFGDLDALDFDTTLVIGDPSLEPGFGVGAFGGNTIYGNQNGVVLEVGAATRQSVTVRNNDMGGNRAFDFLTGTISNTIAPPLAISDNNAQGADDIVVLDPLAHLNLFFGDSAGGPTSFNEGNTLLPLTTGGTWATGDVWKAAGRAIQTNFQVVVPGTTPPPPENIFIDAAGIDIDEAGLFILNGYQTGIPVINLPGIGDVE